MGGGAFAQAYAPSEPTLKTPRMSPEEYQCLKESNLRKLQSCLPDVKVAVLTEAPEKADYGDVDFFIATDREVDLVEVANYLGAAGVICHSNKKASMGVPKDVSARGRPTVIYKHRHETRQTTPPAVVTEEEYAQIDVEIVSPNLLDWYTFYSSYGDMAGLVGHMVTQLGFSVTDRGFWLRMQELDFSKTVPYANVADRDGMIFLSSDPSRVVQFLGCSFEQYAAGFATVDALYEWLASCRLLSPAALKVRRDNAHERNREQGRPIYARFFLEWLPAHMDLTSVPDGLERKEHLLRLRTKHLEEALDFFEVREAYGAKHAALVRALNNGYAASLLKPLIAKHSGRAERPLNEIVRAFRRYVAFDQRNQPYILAQPHADEAAELHNFLATDHMSLRDAEMTSEWVRLNWQELRGLERQRSKDAAAPAGLA